MYYLLRIMSEDLPLELLSGVELVGQFKKGQPEINVTFSQEAGLESPRRSHMEVI